VKEAHFRFGVGLTGTNIYTSFHYRFDKDEKYNIIKYQLNLI